MACRLLRCLANVWTIPDALSIEPFGTSNKVKLNLIKLHNIFFKNNALEKASTKRTIGPFRSGGYELRKKTAHNWLRSCCISRTTLYSRYLKRSLLQNSSALPNECYQLNAVRHSELLLYLPWISVAVKRHQVASEHAYYLKVTSEC